uniref:Beta-lactamase domain-containing protein n=1 Tax=Steinernema glaseri TaxID=37863 RepID=A0A1I7Y5J5_9BILA
MRFAPVLSSCSFAAAAITYGHNNRSPVNHADDSEKRASKAIKRFMVKQGVPGISVGVSVNGSQRWSSGYGYSDVEQGVPCTGNTVMRIASISKPITAAVAARLIENDKLDIDLHINHYLKDLPKMTYNGEERTITSRQLMCHTGGVRHYKKVRDGENEQVDTVKKETDQEFLYNKEYKNVTEALQMFVNDQLVAEPGAKYLYTTHGYTLLSAVMEKAAGEELPNLFKQLFRELGMNSTYLDVNNTIIANRARYYRRDKWHRLENCPEVNNSYKYAAGGLLSNVQDLLKFANAMLYSFQSNENSKPEPFLKAETVRKLWKGEVNTSEKTKLVMYGLGWSKVNHTERYGGLDGAESTVRTGYWCHSGGAVGASSHLLIKPMDTNEKGSPNGICVVLLANIQDCSLSELAHDIAEIFAEELQN